MATDREPIRRLLALYREGRINEEELLARLASEEPEELASSSRPERGPAALGELLDTYRAAELSGAETIRAWAERTADEELRGGLRVIAAREAAHAELLEQRLRELGREPSATVPEWLVRYNRTLVEEISTDVGRLAAIVARFPDVDTATAELKAAIEQIRDDVLTREILRVIAQDEELTLRWIHEAHARRVGSN